MCRFKFSPERPPHFGLAEVDHLLGNPRKAKAKLGWEPEVMFEKLIEMMVDYDLQLLKRTQGEGLGSVQRDKGF